MAYISVDDIPYQGLIESQPLDDNFGYIVDGLSDGTKDININGITCSAISATNITIIGELVVGSNASNSLFSVVAADGVKDSLWAGWIENQDADNSYGLNVKAGTDASDQCARFESKAGTDYLIINGAGNVSIPNGNLSINGNTIELDSSTGARLILDAATSTDPRIEFEINNSILWSCGIDASDNNKFKISEGLFITDSLVIDTSNNVSIPNGNLSVGDTSDTGNVSINFLAHSSDACIINFGDESDADVGYIKYDHSDNSISIYNNAGSALTIDSSHNFIFAADITITGNNISDSGGVVVTFDGSQNTTLAGDLTVSGGDITLGTSALIKENASNVLGLGDSGDKLATGGETAPDVDAGGLCLNQGANDGNIITCKSSDIAHGITDYAETDTYTYFKKHNPDNGGLRIVGLSESNQGIFVHGMIDTPDTTTATGSHGAIVLRSSNKFSTGIVNLGDTSNLLTIENDQAAKVIFKGDGDIYTDTDQTSGLAGTFDSEDDIQLINAARYEVKGYKEHNLKKYANKLQELGIMQGSFLSHRKITDLQLGAIGQLFNIIKGIAKELNINENQLFEMSKKYI